MENKDAFRFTYSAAQQAEVEQIRKKYLPREADKLELLRRLDRSASQKARAWAITLGVIGALLLGTGMSLCMTRLGEPLGNAAMPAGIGIGLLGMVLTGLAYPLYERILKKERARLAPQILQLADKLLQL